MKLWIDDVRPAPEGYLWIKTVDEAKTAIQFCEEQHASVLTLSEAAEIEMYKVGFEVIADKWKINIIDIDHDAGDYACDGGDYIKLLDWLEETGRNYPIRIHSMIVVGVANMRAIIERNGWTEVR